MIPTGEIRRLAKAPPAPPEWPVDSLDDAELARRIHIAAHLKRFFECWCGDPEFRAEARVEVGAALARRGLEVDPDDARAFLAASDSETPGTFEWTENLRSWRDLQLQFQGGHELLAIASASNNQRYSAWRGRQLARLRFEFSALGDYIVRPAAAFELSKGCSAGCWFCAISAERFSGNFEYAAGQELWRGALARLGSILGRAAGSSFCYWATDSLDNPDYERFASDFREILGTFPPTTTALALKNVARTRSLIGLAQRSGCRLNRFSVLTLAMLRRIHREFTPEDLFLVELVLQNPDALVFFPEFPRTAAGVKVHAGRVMEDPELASRKSAPIANGTIACIVGFLINMVERSIQLVSPCTASPEWPLGYRVHESRQFASVAEFGVAIEAMIERHMPVSIPSSARMRFRPELRYAALADGFRVSSAVHAVEFRGGFEPLKGLIYKELGETIRDGSRTAGDIEHSGMLGAAPAVLREMLDDICASGAIDDSPASERENRIVSIIPAASPALEIVTS